MSVDQTLAERGARYGDFSDHAQFAQMLQDVMRDMPNWHALSADKKQALSVIADKIARIGTGDPEYRDNWHDIQGYAKLAEDRCVAAGQHSLPLPPVSDGKSVDVFATTREPHTGALVRGAAGEYVPAAKVASNG